MARRRCWMLGCLGNIWPMARLTACYFELDVHIATGGVRVGADLLVRLLDQPLKQCLRQIALLDLHLDGDAKAATLARTDRGRASDPGVGSVVLLLLGDVVERAAKAGGVAGGKEMLGRGRAWFARAAHSFWHRQVDRDHVIDRLGVTITATDCGGGGSEQRVDLVHMRLSHRCGPGP